MSVAGCERLAMGPGWGDVADLAGQVGSTASVTGLVRSGGLRRGRARPTPPLRGRADVVVSQGEGTGAS